MRRRNAMKVSTALTGRVDHRDRARFLRMVVTLVGDTNCWYWKGHRDGKGYGQFWFRDRSHWAHRFAYLAFRGDVADGLHVHHECRNPWCVNPDHLTLATVAENTADGNRNRTRANLEQAVCPRCAGVSIRAGGGWRCINCDHWTDQDPTPTHGIPD